MDFTINEVFTDFQNSLSSIDFKAYNPNSVEFQSALNVGLMWYLLNEIGGENVEKIVPMKMDSEKDDISDELYGAKKYFQKFLDSGDTTYKEMAKEELKHAEILIKKANAKLPTGEEKVKLKDYETELRQIYEQVNQ